MEEYRLRDAIMDEQEHATDGKFITWVLAPRTDPKTLDFMCSCETYRRTAMIVKRIADGHTELLRVPGFAVASVFCPAEKRNKITATVNI